MAKSEGNKECRPGVAHFNYSLRLLVVSMKWKPVVLVGIPSEPSLVGTPVGGQSSGGTDRDQIKKERLLC
jgi:hypothetical protein